MTQYIADIDHYNQVIARMCKARRLLWIATADLKDLYILPDGAKSTLRNQAIPFLQVLRDLLKKGVEVRLLHAKEPGTAFREDFDKYPQLWSKLERRLCPRVHMKIIAIDSEIVYIGSANMTGAGMGMKSAANRNFEAGILTDEPGFIDSAMSHFDSIWEGTFCTKCGRKDFCRDRISNT
jgi:phosphatidylserine/phosphatidylglycerophosphate/cardiolipin synthase-like enzyme